MIATELDSLQSVTDGVALHHFALQRAQSLGVRHLIASKFNREPNGELTLLRLADTISWAFDPKATRITSRLQNLLIDLVSSGKPYVANAISAGEHQADFDKAWARYREATGCTTFLTVPVMDSGVARGFACYFADRDFTPSLVRELRELTELVYARMLALGLMEPLHNPLTRRQCQVLKLCADGKSDGDIGALLSISSATAHEHIEHAKRRLNVRTRIQAVVIAVRNGWI